MAAAAGAVENSACATGALRQLSVGMCRRNDIVDRRCPGILLVQVEFLLGHL